MEQDAFCLWVLQHLPSGANRAVLNSQTLTPRCRHILKNPDIIFEQIEKSMYEKAFLLLSFSTEHSMCLHRSSLFLHPVLAAQIAGRLNITPASLHYNLHLCQMNPAASILIGFYGLYTQWCLCMWVWGVRQRAFTEAWRKRKKSFRKWMEVEKWFSCWGSVGLSGILSLSFPPSLSFPDYFTSLHSFYPSVIICQWPACY